MTIDSKQESGKAGPFVCNICGQTYHNDEYNLVLHKKIFHRSKPARSTEDDNAGEQEHHNEGQIDRQRHHNLLGDAFLLGQSLRNLEASPKTTTASNEEPREELEKQDDNEVTFSEYGSYRDLSYRKGKTSRPKVRGLRRWMSYSDRTRVRPAASVVSFTTTTPPADLTDSTTGSYQDTNGHSVPSDSFWLV